LKPLRGMLANGAHHDVTFPAPKSVSQLAFQLEGYGDSDASVAIEVTFTKDAKYAFRADYDYVNPPADDNGGGGGGSDNSGGQPDDGNDPYGGSGGGFGGPGVCT